MITYLPDIPRAFTAIAETIGCYIVVINVVDKKFLTPKILISFIGQIFFQILVGKWHINFWFLGMAINVLWMFLSIYIISNLPIVSSAFLTFRAFIYSEFFASISWQIIATLQLEHSKYTLPITIILYFLFFILILFVETSIDKIRDKRLYTSKQTIIVFIIAIMIFLISNVGFIFPDSKEISNTYTVFTIRTLINIFGIILMYTIERQFHEAKLNHRLDTMNQILDFQHQQYSAYTEGRNILQKQIHDFKHHLEALRIEENPIERENYFKEIQEMISIYGSDIKSGNPALDVILTRKNMFCIQNDIKLTTLINGQLIDFISTVDTYTLVGNALDNAIEAVLKTEDLDKRLIDFRIFEKRGHIVIRIENYTTHKIQVIDTFPETTKLLKHKHGFGLPSIDHIVKKYEGRLSFKDDNHWFVLTITFNKLNNPI